MSDSTIMMYMPTEILLKIYDYLPVKQLLICRGVCSRWKQIIDHISDNQLFWYHQCRRDFYPVHLTAKQKSSRWMVWADVYRSLSLWPKLSDAKEDQDEFCPAAIVRDEIRGFQMLRNGVIAVHKRGSIRYYDALTLKPLVANVISGDYLRYSENDVVVVVLTQHRQMFVMRKTRAVQRLYVEEMYHDVKTFLLLDDEVYYINLADDLFVCKLTGGATTQLYLTRATASIVTIGFSNNRLQVLCLDRNIFTLVENKLVLAAALEPTCNLLHLLHQYNFLELLDWRVYFQWMFVMNHTIPQGPLQDIITTRTYGDVIFVGSNWGVLRIYYQPYKHGEFDLFGSEPVKQYNFMERFDCPVLSLCPIMGIDVLEVFNGHSVFVAMPKKIVVLHYRHKCITKVKSESELKPNLPIFIEDDEATVQIINSD